MSEAKQDAVTDKAESGLSVSFRESTPGMALTFGQDWALAATLSKSGLLPSVLRGKPGDVFVIVLHGKDFGLSPTQALRSMHVIEGRPTMSAELVIGLVKQRKDRCAYFSLVSSSATECTYKTQEVGAPEPTSLTWTIEDATRAGLAGKDNWRKNPAAMLRARCGAALARAVYQDVTAGLSVTEEMLDVPAAESPWMSVGRAATLTAPNGAETIETSPGRVAVERKASAGAPSASATTSRLEEARAYLGECEVAGKLWERQRLQSFGLTGAEMNSLDGELNSCRATHEAAQARAAKAAESAP